jgi:hypothetical protein
VGEILARETHQATEVQPVSRLSGWFHVHFGMPLLLWALRVWLDSEDVHGFASRKSRA